MYCIVATVTCYIKTMTLTRLELLGICVFIHHTSSITGSPSSLYEPHKQHNMTSNYKGLYRIFYKISMEVVKSENSQ